jgi:hypothetical protein
LTADDAEEVVGALGGARELRKISSFLEAIAESSARRAKAAERSAKAAERTATAAEVAADALRVICEDTQSVAVSARGIRELLWAADPMSAKEVIEHRAERKKAREAAEAARGDGEDEDEDEDGSGEEE